MKDDKAHKIDELFRNLHGTFDTEEPEDGHLLRFMAKLESTGNAPRTKNGRGRWWPLSIAASLLLLCTLTYNYLDLSPTMEQRLIQISPEISNTGNYFGGLIEEKVREMQKKNSPATEKIISDAMAQLGTLDKDYKKMEQDLLNGGNSKLILSAMINNFQMRLDLLNNILEQIEEVKTLKEYQNENVTI